MLADEIHAACRVHKTHSTSLTTFESPNGGPLGYIDEQHTLVLVGERYADSAGRGRPGRGPSAPSTGMTCSRRRQHGDQAPANGCLGYSRAPRE